MKMKRIKESFLTLIAFIILMGVIGGLTLLFVKGIESKEKKADNTKAIYNNGIHENCGEWRFVSVAGYASYTYYYECTECHKVLESTELYNQIELKEE